jgi:hypothetical protein
MRTGNLRCETLEKCNASYTILHNIIQTCNTYTQHDHNDKNIFMKSPSSYYKRNFHDLRQSNQEDLRRTIEIIEIESVANTT